MNTLTNGKSTGKTAAAGCCGRAEANCARGCVRSLWYGALAADCCCSLGVPFASAWNPGEVVVAASKHWRHGRKTAAA